MEKKKKELLHRLYEQDGDTHVCHYCGIQEEDFLESWGEFYGLKKRGARLEIDHKDAVFIRGKSIIKVEREDQEDTPEKCVLACALCNMAKSNMFTHDEFRKVGRAIEEIWRERKRLGLKVKIS
jgi:hypothetical protein